MSLVIEGVYKQNGQADTLIPVVVDSYGRVIVSSGESGSVSEDTSGLKVIASNTTNKFRETFETWPSTAWSQVKSTGDIITVDGNTVGASYLVLSIDPLVSGTESYVDTVDSFTMPIEMAVGMHASQSTWGQDLSVEILDRDFINPVFSGPVLPFVIEINISSITQTVSTLTVDTVLPHNLYPGARIGIKNCSDSRLNYPAIVVASILSPTSFTVTGGPNSALPPQTVANPSGAKGVIYSRAALSGSRNGTSMHFENATSTHGFFYTRASSGDVLPSASGSGNTLTGRQATVIGSTSSFATAGSTPYSYSFSPTNEYRLTMLSDRLQWSDSPVDSLSASNSRVVRTQVVPDLSKRYFLRVKVKNESSLTIPSGQIINVVKDGTTTATVTTDRPHNLVTGDLIVGYGVRDVGTGFYPALSTAAPVTVLTSTTFTVTWGTASTNTSYGGYISKVNGGCPQPGALTMSIQSAEKTTLSNAKSQVVLVGSANWSGVSIGDYVNIVGCRDTSTGDSIGIDGAWKVANISTTILTLVEIDGYSPSVLDFAVINCGGGIIKRTDLRLSYVRLFDFERLRVEMMPRPTGDISASVPVAINNIPAVSISGTPAVTLSGAANVIVGAAAHDAAVSGAPNRIGGRAVTANYAGVANNDTVDLISTTVGAQISKPYAIPEAGFNASLSLSATTAVAIAAAGGTGNKRHLTACQAINTGASAVDLIILDGVTERWRLTLPVNVPVCFSFPTEIVTTANTALNANLSATGTVRANFQGYTAP